jgi:hypothetical protein
VLVVLLGCCELVGRAVCGDLGSGGGAGLSQLPPKEAHESREEEGREERMKTLLIRLEMVDAGTYHKAFDWLKNVVWDLIKSDPERYFLDQDPYPLRDALLQAVLQDAMRSKKLYLSVTQTTPGPHGEEYRASICYRRIYVEGEVRIFGEDPWPRLAERNGKTPTEATLAAYLEAVEP